MTTICLNMIVKNESHIIRKTLVNIVKYVKIDYWVICDTGSSDNTIEIIEGFFEELNIPGEIHKHVWKDFSHNRNLSLELAYNKSDYLFIFDADDEIHGSFKLPSKLKYDSYMVIFGGGYTYKRISLINNRKKWKYFGVLHEVIIGQDEMTDSDTITGDYHFISGRTGSRNMNVNKYHEDAVLLEDSFNTTTEEWLKNRYAFYCAQSYKDAKIFHKAIEWYKKTLELDCWNQEKFYACYMVGVLEETQNNTINSISYCLLSLKYDNRRWEGLYLAIQQLLKSGQDNLASILISGIDLDNLINPRDGCSLFINDSIHDYKMYVLIIILAFKSNNIEQGRRAQLKLYDNFDYLPEQIVKDTIYNGQYFIPDDKNIQQYFDRTIDFIQKYSYKYMGSLPDNTILDLYIKKYNKIFDYQGEYRPSQQTSINIIITITACKRANLLRRTIKSMTRNWCDFCMVDKIICIDDGTEKNELDSLIGEFPWIEFIVKDEKKRGHRDSMNLIRDIVIESGAKYWIHMEDDWEFIRSDNYISRGVEYLRKYSGIDVKQVLFNKGYAEIITDIVWNCGTRLEEGLLLHKHDAADSPCGYWPHYSFRPGITCVDVLKNLGDFNTPNTFFELDYANKYINLGYKTAYFDEISCIHIGKLAGKRGGIDEQNSYELNNIPQGVENNIKSTSFNDNYLNSEDFTEPPLPIKVISLKRRSDRREYMRGLLQHVEYDFKDAVDGRTIPSNDPRLISFIGNDFNNNPGTIGCAISHIELWQELMEDTVNNYYIIMEDDIKLKPYWYTELYKNTNGLENTDMVMLGYSMFDNVRKEVKKLYDNDDPIQLYNLALDKYIGGFFCYSINKTGAKKILQSMSVTGIKHGIDYLAVKTVSGLVKKEIRPQIAFTEWNEGGRCIDTDIQNTSETLRIDPIMTCPEKITSFVHQSNINHSHSLYPSKLYTVTDNIKVGIITNYCTSEQACIEFGNLGKQYCLWNNIELVSPESRECDYLVIINKPNSCMEERVKQFDKKRTIIFQMEPWCENKNWGVNTWGDWANPDPNKYLAIIGRKTPTYNNVFWQLEQSYSQLKKPIFKTNIISSICSSKYFDPGHIKRIDFLKYMESKSNTTFDVDIFNTDNKHNFRNYKGAVSPFINKSKGIIQYKYYFMCENNFESGFITEKLWEPILCECLVFYCGAPNVSKYVDPLSFVEIDLDDFDKAYDIISNAIASNLYQQRLPYIRKMKNRLLNEMQFFPRIEKVINDSL